MKNLLSILKNLIPYWHKAFLGIITSLLTAIFSVVSFAMVIPFIGILFSTQQFESNPIAFELTAESITHNFNYILGNIALEKGELNALLFIISIVLIFTLCKNLSSFLGKRILVNIRADIVKDIRNNLTEKILNHDLSYFSFEKRGDIISKIMIDVKEVEISIISTLEIVFKDIILLITYLYALFLLNVNLTFIVLIIFPVFAYVNILVGKVLKKASFRGQKKMGLLVSILEELLTGIKVIKAFTSEDFIKNRFKEQNEYYNKLFKKVWSKRILSGPLNEIITTLSILIIMWYGGKMVLNNTPGFSSQVFIGYLAVFTRLVTPARSMSNGYYNIIRGLASIERLNSILFHKYQIKDVKGALKLNSFKNEIKFENVTFCYKNEQKPAIKNINITIKKGKATALVGKSGSGKSTIADLVPRFFDPDSGNIHLDGIPINQYSIKSLRELFAYVTQQPVLFNDTIYNNILFGNPKASYNDVINASQKAFVHEFVMKKKNKYNTILGEGGDHLSVGEKQRITIARAILKEAPVLILDEATSTLDYESEIIVREALHNLMKDKTTIIIAHNLVSVINADQIYVVNEGSIVEHGTHNELLNMDGYYKKIFNMRFEFK